MSQVLCQALGCTGLGPMQPLATGAHRLERSRQTSLFSALLSPHAGGYWGLRSTAQGRGVGKSCPEEILGCILKRAKECGR